MKQTIRQLIATLGVAALVAVMLVLAPGQIVRAQAQSTCDAGTEAQLSQCILDANPTSDGVVRLVDDIVLQNELPALDSAGTLLLDGAGYQVDGSTPGTALTASGGAILLRDLELVGGTVGLLAHGEALITLDRVTIADSGTGIFATESATITANNVTLFSNADNGIQLNDAASASFLSTTIVDNLVGVADVSSGSTEFEASLIARNGTDCTGDLPSLLTEGTSRNVTGDSSCGQPLTADLDDTLATELGTNFCETRGGVSPALESCIRTMALLPGSPAIDASYCTNWLDARSIERSTLCDAGAFEAVDCGDHFVRTEEDLGLAFGCYNNPSPLTSGVDTQVYFKPDTVIQLTQALPVLQNDDPEPPTFAIIGGEIDASGLDSPIVHVAAGDVWLGVMKLSGSLQQAVLIANGVLEVSGSTITGNGREAILASGGASVEVRQSTLHGNGSGIVQTGLSTISLTETTIADNAVGLSAASPQSVTVAGSLIARNSTDCFQVMANWVESLASDDSCNGAGDPLASTRLAPELQTGGESTTPTLALLPGSPAIDFYASCEGGIDQRQAERLPGLCDAGAYEAFDEAVALCNGLEVTIDLRMGSFSAGTDGDDVILGTSSGDNIHAGDGNDTICAGGGDDRIFGGAGDDTIFGQDGQDIVRGNEGNDTIAGGAGDDRLLGGIGDDMITGGAGDDYIGGFGGNDIIDGGAGNETIFGGFGADTINGGLGADVISGLIGNDIIDGGAGSDVLSGNRGNDTINGGSGNDTIRGGNANDVLQGDAGDDSVSGGKADDALSGGPDIDVCVGNLHIVADTADTTCETIFGVP